MGIPDPELIREQARRLFIQRTLLSAHVAIYVAALIVLGGQLFLRFRLGLALWTILLLLHGVIFVLYEIRETSIRQSYELEKRKREREQREEAAGAQRIGLGDDGELVDLEDDPRRQQGRNRQSQQGR
jgi:hypothetical protein